MNPLVGQVALGLYAVLLAAGGVMGYVKAGSKPSLIAGLGSGLLALGCELVIRMHAALGLWLGAALAALLLCLFSVRLAKSPKFMPSGMLCAVSGVVLVLLAVVAVQVNG
jgi:uncharacterized membrane protein (UPF0136 family)